MPTEASWKTLKDYLLLETPISILCACHRGLRQGTVSLLREVKKQCACTLGQIERSQWLCKAGGGGCKGGADTGPPGRGDFAHWDTWERKLRTETMWEGSSEHWDHMGGRLCPMELLGGRLYIMGHLGVKARHTGTMWEGRLCTLGPPRRGDSAQ